MTQYFVLKNLNHDNAAYRRGDVVELPEAAAQSLIEAGVVSTEKPIDRISDPHLERIQSAEDKAAHRAKKEGIDAAKIGGDQPSTGEPSIDSPGEASAQRAEAVDITPLQDLKREELNELAKKEGIDAETIAAAPNKAAVIELIETNRAAAQEPGDDPSANL